MTRDEPKMMRRDAPRCVSAWWAFAIVSTTGIAWESAGAQTSGATGTLQGTVFDSLTNAPLAGALVSVTDAGRSTIADGKGRFRIDSIPAGTHAVVYSHVSLDSIGLYAPGMMARIEPGQVTSLRLATPSKASLYLTLCGTTPPKEDDGILYGAIRVAEDNAVVQGARITASWVAAKRRNDKITGFTLPEVTATTGANGSYAICGVATGVVLSVTTMAPPYASGPTERQLDPERPIARHDLLVSRDVIAEPMLDSSAVDSTGAARPATDSTPASPRDDVPILLKGSAVLDGVVRDTANRPLPNAQVRLLGTIAEQRTGESGRFRLTALPSGSHTLEVRALGFGLVRQTVNLSARDSGRIDIVMRKVTSLRGVRVTAKIEPGRDRRDFEWRRRRGFGYFRDEEEIRHVNAIENVFALTPGVEVRRPSLGRPYLAMYNVGNQCIPTIYLDGMRSDSEIVMTLSPDQIRGIEIYPREIGTPINFLTGNHCGAVVVWTTWARW